MKITSPCSSPSTGAFQSPHFRVTFPEIEYFSSAQTQRTTWLTLLPDLTQPQFMGSIKEIYPQANWLSYTKANTLPAPTATTTTIPGCLWEYTTPKATAPYLEWTKESGSCQLLFGVPIDERTPGQKVPLNDIVSAHYILQDRGLLLLTALFDDTRSLAFMDLANPQDIKPVNLSRVHCTLAMVSLSIWNIWLKTATYWSTTLMVAPGYMKAHLTRNPCK